MEKKYVHFILKNAEVSETDKSFEPSCISIDFVPDPVCIQVVV